MTQPRPPRVSRFAKSMWILAFVVTAGFAGAVAVFFGVLWNPSYDGRTPSGDRLHQIGLAILLYQLDHGGVYPVSVQELARAEHLDPDLASCPAKGGPHLPMVYFGWPHGDPDSTVIIAYTPLAYHGGDGVDALFGDGHGQWLNPAELQKNLDLRREAISKLDATTQTPKDSR